MVNNSEQLCKPTGSSTLPSAYLNTITGSDLGKLSMKEVLSHFLKWEIEK